MSNETNISTMTKAELLKLRSETIAQKKKEELELSRLNGEYRKFGKRMSRDAYNGTVSLQDDCKARIAHLTDKLLEIKDALRKYADEERAEGDAGATLMKHMTLRDYFAAKAMLAVIISENKAHREGYQFDGWGALSDDCYNWADAMLKAREQ